MRRRDGRSEILEVLAGKPVGLGLFAVTVVGYGSGVIELLRRIHTQGEMCDLVVDYPPTDWLRMYTRSRRVWAWAAAFDGTVAETLDEGLLLLRGVKALRLVTADEIRVELEAMKPLRLQRMVSIGIRALQGQMLSVLDEVEKEARGALEHYAEIDVTSIESQFFARIWLPCLILHRMSPAALLRKARLGDLDAIEDLLALDKTILADPQVIRHVNEASRDRHPARMNRIRRALDTPRGTAVKIRRLKYSFAGMISTVSRKFGHRFTEPHIRMLFDGIARIRGQTRDADLPAGSEIFAKAIQRTAREWRRFDRTDVAL